MVDHATHKQLHRQRKRAAASIFRSGDGSAPKSAPARIKWVAVVGLMSLLAGAGCQTFERAPLPRGDGPSLVLLISIDQARAEYLTRFRPAFTGGLAYLLDNGAVFTDAHQNHSMTATAPGHATLATGLNPGRSGIVGNGWYDRERAEQIYSARRDDVTGPGWLMGTALGDWMKAADSRSKVFSASAKDRSAVIFGGQNPNGAYWYNQDTGAWRTSSYYGRRRRVWVQEYNSDSLLDSFFGVAWEPLPLPDTVDLDELGMAEPDTGAWDYTFPHVIGRGSLEPDIGFYNAVYDSPLADWYLARFAMAILDNEGLGDDGSPDLLAISFSAADTVGHSYGPNSREVLDVFVRLDRALGELFDFIEREVGMQHVVIGLSADHGVAPLPEVRALQGEAGERRDPSDVLCVQGAGTRLEQEFGLANADWASRDLYLNPLVVEAAGYSVAAVESRLAELVMACPSVLHVLTATQLAAGSQPAGVDPEIWQRARNNFHPLRSPNLLIVYEPFFLEQMGMGTTHGSPHHYDSNVPFVVVAPGASPAVVDTRVNTVDMAPTLATLLGIPMPDVDGVERTSLLPWR